MTHRDDPPSPRERFLADVLAVVQATDGITEARPKGGEFAIEYRVSDADDDDEPSTAIMYLDNLFAETRELSPDDRRAAVRRFVDRMAFPPEAPKRWEDVRPLLRPVLRSMSFFDDPAITEIGAIWREVVPFLAEAAVIDLPTTMTYVTMANLETWGVSVDEVLTAARDAFAPWAEHGIEPYDDDASSPVWWVAADDAYESSRLLVPGWLARFAGRVRGRPVAAVPHRGLVLIGGDGDAELVERLAATAEGEYHESARAISPALYTVDDAGALLPFTLGADDPLAGEVGRGHRIMAAHEYAQQKARLDALHEKDNTDLFVASYTALERSDGSVISYCVWGEGVEAWLPRTDLVTFLWASEQRDPLTVRWDDVAALVGEAWRPVPHLLPRRMHVRRWPDRPALQALIERAVALSEE